MGGNNTFFESIKQSIISAAAWLREQAVYLSRPTFTPDTVLKMAGSNTKEEKDRVMGLFREVDGLVSSFPSCLASGRECWWPPAAPAWGSTSPTSGWWCTCGSQH